MSNSYCPKTGLLASDCECDTWPESTDFTVDVEKFSTNARMEKDFAIKEEKEKELKELFGMCEFCFNAAVAMCDKHTPVCETCANIVNHLFLKASGNKQKCFCAMCGYPAMLNNKGEIAVSKETAPYSCCEGCYTGEKQPLTEFEKLYFEHLTGVKH